MTMDEVIKALSCCVLRDPDDRPRCGDCPYPSGSACCNRLKADALALLKQEPKRGRWLECEDGWCDTHYQCSECGMEWNLDAGTPEENDMYYCPNCGARMEETP